MNRDDTLALWEQGTEAWNAWAEEMLSRPNKGTPAWEKAATVHFD